MVDIKKLKVGDKVILRDSRSLSIPQSTECTVTGFYQGLDKLVEISSEYGNSTVYPHRLHGVSNNINICYSDGSY